MGEGVLNLPRRGGFQFPSSYPVFRQREPNPPEGQNKVVTIKQLESKAEIAVGLFLMTAFGALVDGLQNGWPGDWPAAKKMLLSAATAGLVVTFGWIKMRSPFQPDAKAPGN